MLLDKSKKKSGLHFLLRDPLGIHPIASSKLTDGSAPHPESTPLHAVASESGHRSILRDRDLGASITSNTLSLSLLSLFRKTKISHPSNHHHPPSKSPNGLHTRTPSPGDGTLSSTPLSGSPPGVTHPQKVRKHRLKRFFKKHSHIKHLEKSTKQITQTSNGLFDKYGRIDRQLGVGASGLVSLVVSRKDPTNVYAVKKFRSRLPQELVTDYETKVRNEFKIGEVLKHQNLIHTFELIKERGMSTFDMEPDYYIVMEYCPFDFFNLVMSGLMTKNEVYCYLKQIVNGTLYLHRHGLAHRDLKLDNCVVTKDGILKLIDFGLAFQFRKYDSDTLDLWSLIPATGIVGLDPYLAPEVFESLGQGYDVRMADVWLIAIIYCCMVMKRFPWKLPKDTDTSYREYAGIKTIGEQLAYDGKPDKNIAVDTDSLKKEQDEHTAGDYVLDSGKKEGVRNGNETDPESIETSKESLLESRTDVSVPSKESDTHERFPRGTLTTGAEKLLKSLPLELHEMVLRMLQVDHKKRIVLEDVPLLPFFQSIECCYQENDEVIRSKTHTHHLVTEEELEKIQAEKARRRREQA